MATKKSAKTEINDSLISAFEGESPEHPALSTSDKNYLKGLKRRGFTDAEIIKIASKNGFIVTSQDLIVAPKKPKKVVVTA